MGSEKIITDRLIVCKKTQTTNNRCVHNMNNLLAEPRERERERDQGSI